MRSIESVRLVTAGSTVLFETDPSYITIDTDYRLKVTRNSSGVFTGYIKGGAFGWDD